ncbi:membrane dipeptidase [Antarcticibacterium flavum]|uniref:Membrane dipeptidase n=1 Tax=Antarcticibacterium flavum TaxID=2058175 RepID=A0A5B7WYY7_9FLAO|nr:MULTISPECIES: dipeptidase [Antarcticibacterium]MCM4158954.1 peptidase M19 [Antarcticibacterium sp. W02-3]QCY68207.1 membrane dipeptidase [Antarcticibacterium flavum]
MKLPICLLLSILGFNLAVAQDQNENQLLEKAKAIHKNVITIDTHADINVNNFTAEKNYTTDIDTQVNLPKMEAGGLDVAWFIVYTGQGELTPAGYEKAYENAMSKFDAIHRLVNEIAPDKIGLATSSTEVRNLVNRGKLVGMIGVENAYPVGEDLGNIEKFYNLGARYMSLSHNGHSQLSDSNTGEEDNVWLHNGLSDMGKEAVREMNRVGMMIDVSHPSKEAIKQMFEISKAPLIASHSSARALCDHSRNLDDELLMLFKEHGGVVQTVAFSAYVNTEKHNAFTAAQMEVYRTEGEKEGFKVLDRSEVRMLEQEERAAYMKKFREIAEAAKPQIEALKKEVPPVDVADFVDHIDYMVDLIGLEHVGISSDFDGGGGIEGWNDASETLNVTIELVRRGYSEEEIGKLWGGNLLRVMDEVEAVAKNMQKI